ncbi:MAG: acyl--CoA ligase [bacterium]|nr:acyl--CoA ligase [bacterium]
MPFPLEQWVSKKPDEIFLYTEERSYRFAEFLKKIFSYAYFFDSLKHPYLRVMFVAEPTIELLAAVIAVWRVNGCVLILPSSLTHWELEIILSRYSANCIITDEHAFHHYTVLQQKNTYLFSEMLNRKCEGILSSFQLDQMPYSPCLMILTSGTTGTPKLVKHSWTALMNHAEMSACHLQLSANDCWLLSLPLHHIGGIASVFKSFYRGLSLAWGLPFSTHLTINRLETAPITRLSMVPTMLQDLTNEYPSFWEKRFTSILLGGGYIPKQLVEQDQRVLATYGLSEAGSQVTTVPPNSALSLRRTCGLPLPKVTIQIRDEKQEVLNPNQEGEIWIQTPAMALGYESNEIETQLTFQGEWLRTNDIGYVDEQGALTIVSRISDRIVTGGKKVDAREVEMVLLNFPDVQEVAIVPVPSKRWGFEVGAAVVLKGVIENPQQQIENYLRKQLSSYKIPKQWLFLSNLPKLTNGKLDKSTIVSMFEGKRGSSV